MNVNRKYILGLFIIHVIVPYRLYGFNKEWFKKKEVKIVGAAIMGCTSIIAVVAIIVHLHRKQAALDLALYGAANNKNNLLLIQNLVKRGANVNRYMDTPKETPFIAAYFGGEQPVINYFLNHGANVNAQDTDGMTLLLRLVQTFRIGRPIFAYYKIQKNEPYDKVHFLLEHFANPNIQNKTVSGLRQKTTVLIEAIISGYPRIVEDLLIHGAKPELRDGDNNDAFWYAEQTQNDHMIQLLARYKK